jgi:hypothetical protein
VHVRNYPDSPNAGFTNTVILRGSNGSRLQFHEDLHLPVTPGGMELSVDHQQVDCAPAV